MGSKATSRRKPASPERDSALVLFTKNNIRPFELNLLTYENYLTLKSALSV